MRSFYVFKIKREISILTREIPYNLYKTIDNLYYLDTNSMDISFQVYKDLFDTFDINYMNKRIYNLFKSNRYYTYENNIHKIENKYRPEKTILKVYKSHLYIKSDAIDPTLLVNYLMSDNLFVCDFKNKDYFWLNEFVR